MVWSSFEILVFSYRISSEIKKKRWWGLDKACNSASLVQTLIKSTRCVCIVSQTHSRTHEICLQTKLKAIQARAQEAVAAEKMMDFE